jgi:hypothetical protein
MRSSSVLVLLVAAGCRPVAPPTEPVLVAAPAAYEPEPSGPDPRPEPAPTTARACADLLPLLRRTVDEVTQAFRDFDREAQTDPARWSHAVDGALEPLRRALPTDERLRALVLRYLAVARAEIDEVRSGEGPSRDAVDEETEILDALAAYCGADEDLAEPPDAVAWRTLVLGQGLRPPAASTSRASSSRSGALASSRASAGRTAATNEAGDGGVMPAFAQSSPSGVAPSRS